MRVIRSGRMLGVAGWLLATTSLMLPHSSFADDDQAIHGEILWDEFGIPHI